MHPGEEPQGARCHQVQEHEQEHPFKPSMLSLIAKYQVLLFDAYGVLVDKVEALPGARDLMAHLNTVGKSYYVLTNSASRLPADITAGLQQFGLEIPEERIVTSGALLGRYFQTHALAGKRCVVLGTEQSRDYVMRAGGMPVPPEEDAEVVVIADQAGFPFLETIDAALSSMIRRLDAGQSLHLLLCNPDLIYPFAPGRYGITAGSVAAVMEAVLQERYPEKDMGFVRLGKPHAPIFEEAARRAGTRDMILIGDQLHTDILGARRFGIDSALVLSGLSRRPSGGWPEDMKPTYVLESLAELHR